ncbi:MAG TPA: hypothetical protein ENK57_06955, partial [Polyangiaceae bacterium]|nr:hypothetical protein [Polyangiaceae bacterium]
MARIRLISPRSVSAALVGGAIGSSALGAAPGVALAETHHVATDGDLFAASRHAKPGDVIEIEGGKTYKGRIFFEGHGEPDKPIIVRGIPKNGQRPVLKGGDDTIYVSGNHYVFESIELTGGTHR